MLKVIGAGMGRTGTHSLALALEKLGFGPCYTLLEVNKNPGHHELWHQVLVGKAIDWPDLFQNYHSAVEWPTAAFLDQLLPMFPDAQVILTLRDPDSWFESASTTIFPALAASEKNPDPEKRTKSSLKRRLILDGVFSGRYMDRQYAITVFIEHNEMVQKIVPADRLLTFQVHEGWLPLCDFLGVPEPAEQFPHRNQRTDFLASAPAWARREMGLVDQSDNSL